MTETIHALNPHGKAGVNISRAKYDQVQAAIVRHLETEQGLSFNDLRERVIAELDAAGFEGSPSWYFTTVKLDLEARGVIGRMPRTRPQRLRLIGG